MFKSDSNTIDGSEYKTLGEVFNYIARTVIYGSWRDTANMAVSEGLYAQDLIDLNNEALEGFGWFPDKDSNAFKNREYGYCFPNKDDMVVLSEMMAEIRAYLKGVTI